MDFTTLTGEDLTAAIAGLDVDFATLSDEALAAALDERRTAATGLFALESPTIEQADAAEALIASIGSIETEQTRRTTEAAQAGERFAAARAAFNSDPAPEPEGDPEPEPEPEPEGDPEGDPEGGDGDGVTTASAASYRSQTRARVPSAASRVAARTQRPAVADNPSVVITASAGLSGVGVGQPIEGMAGLASAVMEKARGFGSHNLSAARAARSASGGAPVITKSPTANIHLQYAHGADLTSKSGQQAEYDAVGEAVKAHVERIKNSLHGDPAVMAAAMAWCSPSEVAYNWVADFVVDGIKTLPEVNAPRGGLMLTEGPQLLQDTDAYGTGAKIDDFGFGGTEEQMEQGYVKQFETIVCPEFEDYRLDFDGYGWMIPILTEATFPELVADAMRVSDVAYAHKINRRVIRNILSESTAVDAGMVYGGSVLDTLEALVQVAVKERRWWNLGENAVMEVTLPQHAREIFKFDMARRSGLALNDVATDQKLAAYFANHNLSVDYVSDFDDLQSSATPKAVWPGLLRAIIYPAGTFLRLGKDVISLSTIHDAASLAENEYLGVFFEQGLKIVRRGYRSHVVTVPVCTAGATGGDLPTCVEWGSV